jgi:hypothetical protein
MRNEIIRLAKRPLIGRLKYDVSHYTFTVWREKFLNAVAGLAAFSSLGRINKFSR